MLGGRGHALGAAAGAQRLLDLLDRPKRSRAFARELGITREGVRQLIIRLHAQGRISFGDPDDPL